MVYVMQCIDKYFYIWWNFIMRIPILHMFFVNDLICLLLSAGQVILTLFNIPGGHIIKIVSSILYLRCASNYHVTVLI